MDRKPHRKCSEFSILLLGDKQVCYKKADPKGEGSRRGAEENLNKEAVRLAVVLVPEFLGTARAGEVHLPGVMGQVNC